MPIGKNAPRLLDSTEQKRSRKRTGARRTGRTNSTTAGIGKGSRGGVAHEDNKATVYIRPDIMDRLHNFAYWADASFTKALNAVLEDGLKGKPTQGKPKPKYKI
jgi:hypothetical protein